MPTAAAIRDICENRFSDTANVVRSEAEWLDYINAAYRLFVQVARWPSAMAAPTVLVTANSRSVAAPAAALQGGIVGVLGPAGEPLLPQPADMPARTVRFLLDQPSKPQFWQQAGSRIVVLPAPAADTTLTVLHMVAPAPLIATDTPLIPETYHDALVAGALARAYRDDDAHDLAAAYDAEFNQYVEAAKGGAE